MKKILMLTLMVFGSVSKAADIQTGKPALVFDCTFTTSYDVTYAKLIDETMNMKYMIMKHDGQAYMVGNNGSSELIMHHGFYAVSFAEFSAAGIIQSTSIYTKDGAPYPYTAIHSRHSISPTGPIFSQWYGTCTET